MQQYKHIRNLSLIHISHTRADGNIGHSTATKTGECSQGKQRETEQRDGKGNKGGYIWPTSRKRFPKSYEKVVNQVKGGGNNSTKRETTEADNKPSKSTQWWSRRKQHYTINNIYPVSYTHLDVYKRQGIGILVQQLTGHSNIVQNTTDRDWYAVME